MDKKGYDFLQLLCKNVINKFESQNLAKAVLLNNHFTIERKKP